MNYLHVLITGAAFLRYFLQS